MHRLTLRLIAATAIATQVTAAIAQTAPAPITDLRGAILSAYDNNPQLLAQRSALRGTDNRLPQARALYGPTLDVEVSHGYQVDRTDLNAQLSYTTRGWSTTASLILNQPLFTFGRLRSAEEGARAEIAFGRDSLRLVETQLLVNVVTSYAAVQRDAALVDIADQNLALLQRQYDDNRERFAVREITIADLQQVETRLETGRATLLEARAQLGASRAGFIQYVGAAPGILAPPALLQVRFESLEEAQAAADANSAVVRAAHAREKISRAGLAVAHAERGPRVDLRGTASNGSIAPYLNSLRANSVRGEVALSMPLFDSGLRSARIAEAQEANQADWRLIDQAGREVRASVSSNWDALAAARSAIGHYSAAVAAAQRAYDGAVLQQRAGARTTLDVLNLARDLLDVRTRYVSALANEHVARANLLSATGMLEAPLLIPDIDAYDPGAHLRRVDHKGDVPLLTPAVRALDSIATGSARTDRASRDPAAATVPQPQMQALPPPPVESMQQR